jgi:spore maturation protein CgeB
MRSVGDHFDLKAVKDGQIRTTDDIKVACILDDFSFGVLRDELHLIPIKPDTWYEPFNQGANMLLVEAFWRGSENSWRGIAYDYNFKEREFLRRIVRWCRHNGIPTVFWAKEDPPHVDEFIDLALEFDHIFTTDLGSVPRYKEKGKDAMVLQFAAQPSIHNPTEYYPTRERKVSFAGSFIHLYPERNRDLNSITDNIEDFGIDIFDRNLDRGDAKYKFPERYKPMVKGTLKGNEILRSYKGYRYGLNLNSIKRSDTMFARRVFELMACNTVVISNKSVGMEKMFGDLVISSDDGAEIRKGIDALEKDERSYRKLRLRALRAVMEGHTYRDRVDQMASAVFNIEPISKTKGVTVIATAEGSERPEIHCFDLQIYKDKRLVHADMKNIENVAIIVREASSEGRLLAKMRSQDHYGPHFLGDMAMAFYYSDPNVVTKLSRFVVTDRIAEDGNQYRTVDRTSPGAVMIDPSKMSIEEAVDIITGNMEKTPSVLSIDEFNYIESVASGTDTSFCDS